MESELFDWKEWDNLDGVASFIFFDVTLKQPIGEFQPGKRFAHAALDYSSGILAFLDGNARMVAKFNVGLVVKENSVR